MTSGHAAIEIPAALQAATDLLLERFHKSCNDAGLTVPEEIGNALPRAFTVSRFIAETAITQPQGFLEALAQGPFTVRNAEDFAALGRNLVAETETLDQASQRLRRARNLHLALIAWHDIIGGAAVDDLMVELSGFADACINAALEWCHTSIAVRYGTPCDANGAPMGLHVIGMGKLGGQELNFSSDIDLIFAFPAGGDTVGGRRQISNQEFFDKLGRQFIALLNDTTADGFVFRVDMRLRPFGDSGPLTASFGALEHYYQLHGRDWERYAFIKARVITGAPAQTARLEAILKPFVYRRYLDYGAFESVREMKRMIESETNQKDLNNHVKLGPGGIREIEFIGQTMQLIRGGQEAGLRSRSLMSVLKVCVELNLIETNEQEELSAAYRFLRQTEHRLQQLADQQTHRLPTEETECERLAFAMGFSSYAEFVARLDIHRANVRRCFQDLLSDKTAAADDDATRLWREPGESDAVYRSLGYADAQGVREVLTQLKAPSFLDRLSREGRERLDRLMPLLIEHCAERSGDTATFARLSVLIRNIARRSVYLALLSDHPATLKRLIDLFDASPWIAQQITQQPMLLDELLDARLLHEPASAEQLIAQLGARIRQIPSNDTEQQMDALRHFKNRQVLRVAVGDIMDQFPVAEVSNQLSFIAHAVLHHALLIATTMLEAKHGKPTCVVDGAARDVGFAIIAYGKLGGFELGYGSDLDLVFIHDGAGDKQQTDGERVIDNEVFFTRLTQRIIHLLSTRTAAGTIYEIDTRLRPSGASGLLVTSISAFTRYQKDNAWTWEHQALIRARAIVGDARTMAAFEKVRCATLNQKRDEPSLRADIIDMRERIRSERDRSDEQHFDVKQAPGGITDIEFMVQYAVLRWVGERAELLEFTDNLRLLEVLTGLGLIPESLGATLHDAYFAYRAATHRSALQEAEGLVEAAQFSEHRAAISNAWREWFGDPSS